jgi:uncharacterized protein
MTSETNLHYVNNRVLKINVGFLLNDSLGTHRNLTFDVPTLRVSDDLTVDYLRGNVRLSRTSEGILLQGDFVVGMVGECSRCLTAVQRDMDFEVEEIFAYPVPRGTEFAVGDDGILDLAPLVRAETMIAQSRVALCRPNCKGLCPTCGINRNEASCQCGDQNIDPRMAKLKELLNPK